MLKLLACLFMAIDHVGHYYREFLSPEAYMVLRMVGRLAFPIFARGIALGFARTRSPFRYLLRMSVFAVAAQAIIGGAEFVAGLRSSPFAIGDPNGWTNILFTFAFAILLLIGYELTVRSFRDMIMSLRTVPAPAGGPPACHRFDVRVNFGGISLAPCIGIPVGVAMVAAAFALTALVEPDYSLYGLLAVLAFHLAQGLEDPKAARRLEAVLFIGVTFMFYAGPLVDVLAGAHPPFAIVQLLSILALPLMWIPFREKRPGPWGKYFFYAFYPLHMAALALGLLLFPTPLP